MRPSPTQAPLGTGNGRPGDGLPVALGFAGFLCIVLLALVGQVPPVLWWAVPAAALALSWRWRRWRPIAVGAFVGALVPSLLFVQSFTGME